jgi:UrcA family protein
MSNFVAKTANVALFAVAALPFIALATARAEPVTVKVSDLNMARPAQVQEFNARVDHAANQICSSYTDNGRNLTANAACSSAVRAEAQDQLAQRQSQSASVTMASR